MDWIGTFKCWTDHVQRRRTLRQLQTMSKVPRVLGDVTTSGVCVAREQFVTASIIVRQKEMDLASRLLHKDDCSYAFFDQARYTQSIRDVACRTEAEARVDTRRAAENSLVREGFQTSAGITASRALRRLVVGDECTRFVLQVVVKR